MRRIGYGMIAVAALFLTLFMTVRHADAHKVMIFGYVEGDTVYAEGYFSDGKKAINSHVEVFDDAGKKLLEGKTDDKGQFVFKVPGETELNLVLTASMGHKARFTIPARKSSGTELSEGRQNENAVSDSNEQSRKDTGTTLLESRVSTGISEQQLRSMIDEALERKLRPVIDSILELNRKGPSIIEIFGGIGYIFGIFGIILYFRCKRKETR
jgi:nickel transport protein